MSLIMQKLKKYKLQIKRALRAHEDNVIEGVTLMCYVIVGGVTLLSYLIGHITLISLIETYIGLIVTFLPLCYYLLKKTEKMILIGGVTQYLLDGDETLIDDLLGKMIAGKFKLLTIEPTDALMDALEAICEGDDWEMRRRVSEALPVLLELNLERTEKLFTILRGDWDYRWRSDIRRRVIEATPCLWQYNPTLVKELLRPKDSDEIFTTLANVEMIATKVIDNNKEEGEKIFKELCDFAISQYKKEEMVAIKILFKLLHKNKGNPSAMVSTMITLSKSNNIFIKICVARNLPQISKTHMDDMLILMQAFVSKSEHKYVRRPIAKEESIACIIRAIHSKKYSERGKEIFWSLIKDEDEIIRITAFDKADELIEIDKEFGKNIVEYILTNEKEEKLIRRAKRIAQRLNTLK